MNDNRYKIKIRFILCQFQFIFYHQAIKVACERIHFMHIENQLWMYTECRKSSKRVGEYVLVEVSKLSISLEECNVNLIFGNEISIYCTIDAKLSCKVWELELKQILLMPK